MQSNPPWARTSPNTADTGRLTKALVPTARRPKPRSVNPGTSRHGDPTDEWRSDQSEPVGDADPGSSLRRHEGQERYRLVRGR